MVKKAQSKGSSAATLVLVILLIIIFYILFLPPEERAELLDEKEAKISFEDGKDTKPLPKNVLLEETDISLSPFEIDKNKDLPNVYLFEIINAKEIASFNPFVIRNGLFDKEFRNLTFTIEDIEKTENILLSMRIKEGSGTLTIKLNGIVLYEYPAKLGDIDPIKIDKKYLEDINYLEFTVDGVGARFWRTNEYNIEKAKITADITDISKQKSRNIFTLSASEYDNLESAKLHFTPSCDKGEAGIIDILVNNREIFSAIPECNDIYRQPVPIGLLEEGDNYVIFQTTKGTYTIENINVELNYKETQRWKYSFNLDEDEYEDVVDDDKDVKLKIKFKGNTDKRGDFKVNDRKDSFDLDEDEYSFEQDISRWIEEDSNTITIEPKTELTIDYIRVELI